VKRTIILIFFWILVFNPLYFISQYQICFNHKFQNDELIINKKNIIRDDTITISSLNYYISMISLNNNSKIVYLDNQLGHLISHENHQSSCIVLDCKKIKFNSIHFKLGIDSITHTKGVLGNDLDPSKGMYWTWRSGYINLKVEGYSTMCAAKKHFFQFHIGGYQHLDNTSQNIDLQIKEDSIMNISFDLYRLMNKIDLSQTFQIMSPSKTAVEISNYWKDSFYVE